MEHEVGHCFGVLLACAQHEAALCIRAAKLRVLIYLAGPRPPLLSRTAPPADPIHGPAGMQA